MIAVDFGYSDPPVTQLRPDRLIGHLSELAAAVWELAAATPVAVRPGLGR